MDHEIIRSGVYTEKRDGKSQQEKFESDVFESFCELKVRQPAPYFSENA